MASKTTADAASSSSDRPKRTSITDRPLRPPDCPTPAPGGIRGPNPPRAKCTKVVAKLINDRGKNYSDYETNLWLDVVEHILPHGGIDVLNSILVVLMMVMKLEMANH